MQNISLSHSRDLTVWHFSENYFWTIQIKTLKKKKCQNFYWWTFNFKFTILWFLTIILVWIILIKLTHKWWVMNILRINTIKCKKLATIASGQKIVTWFFRRKQVNTTATFVAILTFIKYKTIDLRTERISQWII